MRFVPISEIEEKKQEGPRFVPIEEEQKGPRFVPIAQEEDSSDLVRGFTNILPQLKETFGAAKVLTGKSLSDKEMMESGRELMKAGEEATVSKESDSFTRAWEEGIGTVLTDWLPYQIGAGAGSLVESLAFMGIGTVGGATAGAGVGALPGAVAGAVSKSLLKKGVKEAAEKVLKEEGEEAAKLFVQKQTKRALRGMGAEAGLIGQAAVHGAGEVTSRAVEELEKQGKTMEDLDMSRVMPAAVVHGVADYVANKIMLGGFKGLTSKESTNNFIKDVTLAIGKTGIKEIPAEEIQTIAERYGAELSLDDIDALKEYVDTAAASMAMSVVPGGIGGARTYLSREAQDIQDEETNDKIDDAGGFPADTPADVLQKDPAAKVDARKEALLSPTIEVDTGNPTASTATSAENPTTEASQTAPENITTPDAEGDVIDVTAEKQKVDTGTTDPLVPAGPVTQQQEANETPTEFDEPKDTQPSPVAGFKTAKGSTYTIDDQGKTSRTKKSEGKGKGETYAPHSVLYIDANNTQSLLEDMQSGALDKSVSTRLAYVKPGEKNATVVTDVSQIPEDAEPLVLTVNNKTNELINVYKAKRNPEVGLAPVEKLYNEDGTANTHIGNSIVEIFNKTTAQEGQDLTEQEQLDIQAELEAANAELQDETIGSDNPELDAIAQDNSATRGRKARAKKQTSKKVRQETDEYPTADEIKGLGFMDQRSYHSDSPPTDINEAIKSAAAEAAYDAIDSSGNKQLNDTRQAYADVRNEFVNSLEPNQRAIFDLLVERNIDLENRAKEASKAAERKRATGYKRRQREKADVKEQLAEADVTFEEQQTENEMVTQAAVAVTKERTQAENNRRTQVSVEVEKAINETDDLNTVVRAISKENKRAGMPINEFNTREIASAILTLLKNLGSVVGADAFGNAVYDRGAILEAKIVFGEVEGNNDAKFDPATNTITVKGQNGQYTGVRRLDQVVMHETTHYLLDHAVENPDGFIKLLPPDNRAEAKAAIKRLENNYKFIKGKLGQKYNIGTMKEFLAEMFSDSRLQADVANLPSPDPKRNLFSIIIENIAKAFGFGPKTEGVLLKQVLDDMSKIISIPTPELRGTEVSYSTTPPAPTPPSKTPNNPTPKKAKLDRTNDLNDNTGYEIADYQKPRSLGDIYRKMTSPESWRNLVTKFQNSRYPIQTWENRLDLANKIIYDGEGFNNVATQITLSTSRAKNFYHELVMPLHQKLDDAIIKLSKASRMDTEQTLGFVHRVLEALHEPERRRVKYILTVPLSTNPNQGLVHNGKPISAADRRAQIVEGLDTVELTNSEAMQLRAELDRIVDKYADPYGSTTAEIPKPKTPEQAQALLDQNNSLYNVLGLGSDTKSTQQVVAERMEQYKNHPQKKEIDRVLSLLKQFNGPNGVTTNLSKYSNYWSPFVSNRVAFYNFQDYAPFKGKSKFNDHSKIDEVLDFDNVRMGRELQESQAAMDGRTSVSDNPVLQTISDAIRASMRAGRKDLTQSIKNALPSGKYNEKGQGLLKGEVKETIEFKDRVSPETINKYKGDKYIFHYNADGTVDILYVDDAKLRNAIRRTYQASNGFFDKLNIATSFLGKMHTRYNYNFALLNFVRDALTNAWAIGAEMGPKETVRFIGNITSKVVLNNALPKAANLAILYNKGGKDNFNKIRELAKTNATYRDMVEFIEEGGMVSYLQGLSIQSNFEELSKEIGRTGVVRSLKGFNKAIDVWVEMFELASRSAAYSIAKQNALKKGKSEAEAITRAAAYAKNLANFEQVGDYGRQMGAFFMFFRPSATGAVRATEAILPALRSMKSAELSLPEEVLNDPQAMEAFRKNYAERRRNAQYMVASLMAFGALAYMMSSMMSDDDDLGRNSVLTDNMEQWTRFWRMHVPKEVSKALGLKEDTVIQIPWGFGLGSFMAAGAQLAGVALGKESLPNALSNIFLQISLDSFVPLPVSRINPMDDPLTFALDSITPSIARPLFEFAMNTNGLGRNIYNDSNRRMGDAYLGGDNIPEIYNDISRGLFNESVGSIDISPNTLYFLSNSYIDGLARVFELGYGVTNIAEGAKSFNPKTDIPVIGSFFGAKSNVDARDWAKVEKKIQEREKIFKTVEKSENPELLAAHIEKYPFDEYIIKAYNKGIGSDLKELQAAANDIRRNPYFTPKDREELLKVNKLMQNLIKNQLIMDFEVYDIKP